MIYNTIVALKKFNLKMIDSEEMFQDIFNQILIKDFKLKNPLSRATVLSYIDYKCIDNSVTLDGKYVYTLSEKDFEHLESFLNTFRQLVNDKLSEIDNDETSYYTKDELPYPFNTFTVYVMKTDVMENLFKNINSFARNLTDVPNHVDKEQLVSLYLWNGLLNKFPEIDKSTTLSYLSKLSKVDIHRLIKSSPLYRLSIQNGVTAYIDTSVSDKLLYKVHYKLNILSGSYLYLHTSFQYDVNTNKVYNVEGNITAYNNVGSTISIVGDIHEDFYFYIFKVIHQELNYLSSKEVIEIERTSVGSVEEMIKNLCREKNRNFIFFAKYSLEKVLPILNKYKNLNKQSDIVVTVLSSNNSIKVEYKEDYNTMTLFTIKQLSNQDNLVIQIGRFNVISDLYNTLSENLIKVLPFIEFLVINRDKNIYNFVSKLFIMDIYDLNPTQYLTYSIKDFIPLKIDKIGDTEFKFNMVYNSIEVIFNIHNDGKNMSERISRIYSLNEISEFEEFLELYNVLKQEHVLLNYI